MKRIVYHKGGKNHKKLIVRSLGIASIAAGLLTLLYFFFPIVSYHFFLAHAITNNSSIEVPVPKYTLATNTGIDGLLSAGFNSLTQDSTDARTWAPGVSATINTHDIASYLLSIPSIKVDNATVSTNDYNLSNHLVQYYGTITPPKKGTTVIFGHSTLPQLFDIKNYKTIFANLHKVEKGDKLIVNVGGVSFTYTVFEKVITVPTDINIYSQQYDDSYITLVTCTPPGTVWKRLIVRAKLDQLENG